MEVLSASQLYDRPFEHWNINESCNKGHLWKVLSASHL